VFSKCEASWKKFTGQRKDDFLKLMMRSSRFLKWDIRLQ
jgi:hypothetical protein